LENDLEPGVVGLLTCQDMGDILGVTPESVSRVIAELKRRGLLTPADLLRQDLFRCNRERLQRLASR
jgi:CRP-like cAMP-binding protein